MAEHEGRGIRRAGASRSRTGRPDGPEAPICPWCGVTALPDQGTARFVCANEDCPGYAEPVA